MIKIFTFVKDEIDIISDWLKYHSSIFGTENIYVIDQGSTDGTRKIVENFGVNLSITNEPFSKKSQILSNLMKGKNGFLIPLDADEFIAIKSGNSLSSDKNQIVKYINSLPVKSARYKFHQIDSIPSKSKLKDPLLEIDSFNTKWYKDWKHYAKTFYHSKFFKSTDQGNHRGNVVGEGQDFVTDLTIVHYDVRDYDHFVKKMTRGAVAYGHHTSKKLSHGKGRHYHRRYWAIKEGRGLEQMLKEFGNSGNYKTDVVKTKLKQIR